MDEQSGERDLRLADAMNTYDAALGVIRGKSYHLYYLPDEREGFGGDYWAIRDGRDFIASDPLRLLGLITLWEHLGDNWEETATRGTYDEIMDIAFAKGDYRDLSDDAFARLAKHLRIFFDAWNLPLPDHIDRQELAHRVKTLNQTIEATGQR